jgi:hypothetical protein
MVVDRDAAENKKDRIRRAATESAVVGPMVALMLVGFLARLQNFFCPANFLPLYGASFVLLAPTYFLIGLAGAELDQRLVMHGVTRWRSFLTLALGGAVLGALYFESLSFVLVKVLPVYAPLLGLPGVQSALAIAAGLAATWNVLFQSREPQTLGLT